MTLAKTVVQWRGASWSGEDVPGAVEVLTALSGWEGLPPTRQNWVPRPLVHGDFDAPVLAGSRVVTVGVRVRSPQDRDARLAALESIMTLPDPAGPLEDLTITHAGRTLTASARLSAFEPTPVAWGAGWWRWAAQWTCPDPLRYGPPVSTISPLPERIGGLEFPLFGLQDGAATGFLEWGPRGDTGRRVLSNPGTAPVAPTAHVVGPLPLGFSLRRVDTGETLTWAGSLSADEWVDVDFRTKRIRLMGTADRTHLVTSGQWWTVPAATDVEAAFTAPSYDPAASVTWTLAPGWW